MKKMSGIKKASRTSIGDLQDTGCEISDEQLDRVAGGLTRFGGGGFGGGGVLHEGESKCWQASSSVVNPGDIDTAQDWVTD